MEREREWRGRERKGEGVEGDGSSEEGGEGEGVEGGEGIEEVRKGGTKGERERPIHSQPLH